MAFERLMQIVSLGEGGVALQLPVVEVASDDHRGVVGQGFEQLAEQLQLQLAMTFEQAQVHANRMDFSVPRHLQHTVQQPASFGAGDRHIKVTKFADRVFDSSALPWWPSV